MLLGLHSYLQAIGHILLMVIWKLEGLLLMQFWELDSDHNFLLSQEDLLRYGNHALTYRIVDRIFSQVSRASGQLACQAAMHGNVTMHISLGHASHMGVCRWHSSPASRARSCCACAILFHSDCSLATL